MANAFFAYSDNHLIDTDHGVILDVEASRSIRSAEAGATRTMIERTRERFDLTPERLAADTDYGSGDMLGWLAERQIEPHIPVIRCPAGDCEQSPGGTSPSATMAPSRPPSSATTRSATSTRARAARP